jgi:hypothetical protein
LVGTGNLINISFPSSPPISNPEKFANPYASLALSLEILQQSTPIPRFFLKIHPYQNHMPTQQNDHFFYHSAG